jgi:hypothetical protein
MDSRKRARFYSSGVFWMAIFALSFFLASFSFNLWAEAAEVIVRWSPNPEPNVAGYRIYYGPASGNYSFYVDVGSQTSCTISNLEEGKTYYFASTAYDDQGYESDYSAEAVYTVPVKFSISPTSQSFDSSGGTGWINISASPGVAWDAIPKVPWVAIISNPSGTGSGKVQYSVQANPESFQRNGEIFINGLSFRISQAALTPPVVQPLFAVNCGGGKYVGKNGIVYQADTGFIGGGTYSTPAAISGTEEGTLYQTERWGNFAYGIAVPNGNYQVILKFAEIYNYSPGTRVFSVKIEGKEVITNLDLYSKVGRYRAYDVEIRTAVTDGRLNIEFVPVVGNPKVSALIVNALGPIPEYTIQALAGAGGTISPAGEVIVSAGSSQTFTITPNSGYQISDVLVDGASKGAVGSYTFSAVKEAHTIEARFGALPPTTSPFFAVNCGGGKYVDKNGIVYQADTGFIGGGTYSTTAAISGTEDGILYQTERWGNFSYRIAVPNGSYQVTLKFAEIYPYAGLKSRIFDVKVEGQEVIRDLDLVAKVGKFKAHDVTIPVTVTDGTLNIDFSADVGSGKINAILVTRK